MTGPTSPSPDKARALAHYVPMAAEAAGLCRPDPTPTPFPVDAPDVQPLPVPEVTDSDFGAFQAAEGAW